MIKTLAEVEQNYILSTLKVMNGNRGHTARVLGISIKTLSNKLNQYRDLGADLPPVTKGAPRHTNGNSMHILPELVERALVRRDDENERRLEKYLSKFKNDCA